MRTPLTRLLNLLRRDSRTAGPAALWLCLGAACTAAAAQGALTVTATPQGEVGAVQQVQLRFSAPVVAMGAAQQEDPATLACEGASPMGSGRWGDDRNWVLDLREPIPPGARCTLKLRAQWKPLAGTLSGPGEFRFSTGGPSVVQAMPWPGSEIEEDQHFLLRLTGPAVEADIARHAGCEVEGLGERLAVKVVGGAAREEVLRSQRAAKAGERAIVLACARPLPQGAKVRLVWGRGIGAKAAPRAVTTSEQRFEYRVRAAFTAEFSCERERANAPCLPIRPMTVRFSSPVPRALAEAVRRVPLAGGSGVAPRFAADDRSPDVMEVVFPAPGVERAQFRIDLPREMRDASGRPLSNAGSFPLTVATGDAPPLAKFATAPFGVVEWTPEAAVPLTLRHVQGDLAPGSPAGQVRVRRLTAEADVLAWIGRVQQHHETWRSAKELGLPQGQWYEMREDTDARGRKVQRRVERMVHTREVSLLNSDREARRLTLPAVDGTGAKPLEVVGIPITEPGYHVLEVESSRLGQALLGRGAPMFVRTGVLVTNLGVHFKHGRENSAVWVTRLDRGRPVPEAEVAVHDCAGKRLWSGRTDAQGLARITSPLTAQGVRCTGPEGLFVSARKADAKGVADFAFVFSTWNRGIEPWRFPVPVSGDPQPDTAAHTVFDRTLVRAGETVSMKHFLRLQTASGLAWADPARLPTRLKIVHVGSGEEFTQALAWNGARSAVSVWQVPPAARLGSYRVVLERPAPPAAGTSAAGSAAAATAPTAEARAWDVGEFRVEAFRVPLVDARVSGPKGAAIAPRELPLDVQLRHLSGGGVAQAALKTTALLRDRSPAFPGYEEFSFEPAPERMAERPDEEEPSADRPAAGRVVADKLATTTSREGAARVLLKDLPALQRPGEIVAEVSFADPNGEIQTVGTTTRVWPAAVVPGLKASWWVGPGGRSSFTAVALDTAGKPLKGQSLEVRGRLQQTLSTRKRVVGGFYAWEQRLQTQDLGVLCSGRSDERGLLPCEAELKAAGEVELIVSARDDAGRTAQAAARLWVSGGDGWFSQDNDDRIDLLPERRRYEPGETARLQVRMPFRQATALVAIEREGVIDTRVVTLRGDDPKVEVKIDRAWAPNVYVSVLALRGRIRETPWYSLFTWGWREPAEWARSFWYEGKEYRPPTAMVDLARPSFKLGVAALEVGTAAHELQVSVTPDKAQYAVREKARVKVRVTQGGQPAAGAEVAFAAVDEGLLALRGNDSWDLLGAMMRPRAWGVATSTAQGEIVGRRHYGRKAVAPGGGGGRGGTRELFDTLLLWNPRLALDANGEATLEVPMNDSLTSFRLVAVADAGNPGEAKSVQRFGTGSATVRVSQDLQLLAGLPPQVRDGDRYTAMVTLRNTTARAMTVKVAMKGTVAAEPAITRSTLELPAQQVQVAAGGAAELTWPVEVPAGAYSIAWDLQADEQGGKAPARDRLKITQFVAPSVPVRVVQATLQPWGGSGSLPVAAPADALPLPGTAVGLAPGAAAGSAPGRAPAGLQGGLQVTLQPRLGGALPGIRRYFETYPYTCLEQQASRAIGLRDREGWTALANRLPTYLDADGLASYFPRGPGDADRGSDRLTAYLLSVAHEAGFEWPAPLRERMLDGLVAFVEGRIERRGWSPRPDADARRLAALEALARHGRAQPRMTGPLAIAPAQWPTSAVIDWLSVLQRVGTYPDRDRRIDEARQVLRSRLTWSGTTLRFTREDDDFWWWLMESPDANAARLILAAIEDPTWRDDVPRMVVGHLGRQQRGAWLTTTANAWSALALERFSARFESVPVAGRTVVSTNPAAGTPAQTLDWARSKDGGRFLLPWPSSPTSQAAGTLQWQHEGTGAPWATVQALAAVQLKAPVRAGYGVTRTVTAVQRQDPLRWSRGDVARVRVEIEAGSDMTWVVLSDPIPGGAAILGTGLGRDASLATTGERREGAAYAAFEERGADALRATWEYLPRGRHVLEYTVRLNNPGRFNLPPTRVEAMYAPQTYGESPNAPWEVAP